MSDSHKLQQALQKVKSGTVKVQDRTPDQIRHDYKISKLSDTLRQMEAKANERK